jgi:hypothetical protein
MIQAIPAPLGDAGFLLPRFEHGLSPRGASGAVVGSRPAVVGEMDRCSAYLGRSQDRAVGMPPREGITLVTQDLDALGDRACWVTDEDRDLSDLCSDRPISAENSVRVRLTTTVPHEVVILSHVLRSTINTPGVAQRRRAFV